MTAEKIAGIAALIIAACVPILMYLLARSAE